MAVLGIRGTGTTIEDTRGAYFYTNKQIEALLALKEDKIPYGTTSQFWRGDKTWQVVPGGGGGGGGPTDWADITNKPSDFPPSPHTHAYFDLVDIPATFEPSPHTHPESEVINLVSDLAAKEPTIAPGTTAQYWRGDKTWQTLPAGGGGSGDVVGPASVTDNSVARFDLTTGKLIQESAMVIDDAASMTLKNAGQVVLGHDTAAQNGTFTIRAKPPHAQTVTIIPRSDTDGASHITGALTFDNALTLKGKLTTAVTTTAGANFNIPISTGTPSAPIDGDLWFNNSTGSFTFRMGSNTRTVATLQATQTFSGLNTFSVKPLMPMSQAAAASINLPHGTAPTTPVNGDLWTTTSSVYAQVNGTTIDLAVGGAGGGIPEAPTDGQQYGRQSSGWTVITGGGGGAARVYIGDAPPISPSIGDMWWKSDDGNTYIWYFDGTSSQWVASTVNEKGLDGQNGAYYLNRVNHTGTQSISTVSGLQSALDLKAPLDSPILIGDPRAPTPSVGDNDTSIATTAFVSSALTVGVPPGAVMTFARSTAPTGWLKANGAVVSRTTYSALFAAISTTFGAGDGSTTFGLPDFRGEFLRVWDDGRGIDSARSFGTSQTGGVESHTHPISITSGNESAGHTHVASGTTGSQSANHTHSVSDSSLTTTDGVHTHSVAAVTEAVGVSSGLVRETSHAGLGTINPINNSVGHQHTVSISATSGSNSVSHTHSFSDTTNGASANHTHLVSGTSSANTGAATETRPRNIALLACVKY